MCACVRVLMCVYRRGRREEGRGGLPAYVQAREGGKGGGREWMTPWLGLYVCMLPVLMCGPPHGMCAHTL